MVKIWNFAATIWIFYNFQTQTRIVFKETTWGKCNPNRGDLISLADSINIFLYFYTIMFASRHVEIIWIYRQTDLFHYTFSLKVASEMNNSNNLWSLYTERSFLNWKVTYSGICASKTKGLIFKNNSLCWTVEQATSKNILNKPPPVLTTHPLNSIILGWLWLDSVLGSLSKYQLRSKRKFCCLWWEGGVLNSRKIHFSPF